MVRIEGLGMTYSTENGPFNALKDISLDLADGAFVALLGRSGCGKTTLLRLIAGLEKPTAGNVTCSVEAERIGYVFQEARLMPWLTVAENIRFAARNGKKRKEGFGDVEEILNKLGLKGFARALPHELSGGMAQRVALGRTLFCKPALILMDEPFGSLDWFTRRALQEDLLRLWREGGKSVLFVTHDIDEALVLADRIVVMHEGRIVDRFKMEEKGREEERSRLRARILKALNL